MGNLLVTMLSSSSDGKVEGYQQVATETRVADAIELESSVFNADDIASITDNHQDDDEEAGEEAHSMPIISADYAYPVPPPPPPP